MEIACSFGFLFHLKIIIHVYYDEAIKTLTLTLPQASTDHDISTLQDGLFRLQRELLELQKLLLIYVFSFKILTTYSMIAVVWPKSLSLFLSLKFLQV